MDELKDMIALLKRTDFDPAEIDTDLHKRVADATYPTPVTRLWRCSYSAWSEI